MIFTSIKRNRKRKQGSFIVVAAIASIFVLWGLNSSPSVHRSQNSHLLLEEEADDDLIARTTISISEQNERIAKFEREKALMESNIEENLDDDYIFDISPPQPPKKVYKFYDAGTVYHDMNFTCPVPWEWVISAQEADVVWHNVLENRYVPDATGTFRHHPNQKYAFMSLESAAYYPFIFEKKNEGYDFVVDYRIWPDHPKGPADIPAVYLLNPTMPDFPFDFRSPPTMKKRTDAIMAAFISNCESKNNRLDVLERLTKLISVHSYGKCVHNYDQPEVPGSTGWGDSKHALAQKYHFLFTPENSNDMSYVSEKIYDAMKAGAVPVYIGAPDIDRFIPHPMSVIKASEFESTEALADYLKELAADPAKYAKHLEWKKKEFSPEFKRVLRLAARTVQCRVAMKLEGLDFEADLQDLDIFPP